MLAGVTVNSSYNADHHLLVCALVSALMYAAIDPFIHAAYMTGIEVQYCPVNVSMDYRKFYR